MKSLVEFTLVLRAFIQRRRYIQIKFLQAAILVAVLAISAWKRTSSIAVNNDYIKLRNHDIIGDLRAFKCSSN